MTAQIYGSKTCN